MLGRVRKRVGLPLALAALAALAACGDETVGEPPLEPGEVRLQIVSGQQQTAPVLTQLPRPLVVRVVNGRGVPVRGQVVNFRVTAGGGSAYAGVGITNGNGLAQDWWTMGRSPGVNRLEVRAVDSSTGARLVFGSFEARATARP